MSNEFGILLAVGVVALLAGWALAKIGGVFTKRSEAAAATGEHHQIRSLEASLRVAEKKAAEISGQFEATCVDFTELKEAHEQLEAEVRKREAALEDAKQAIRDETRKVQDLRRELTDNAAAKIRAEAHAKEVETELVVMKAGSTVMQDEVDRLVAEHRDLSDRLHAVTGTFEHSLVDTEGEDDRSSEEFQPDR